VKLQIENISQLIATIALAAIQPGASREQIPFQNKVRNRVPPMIKSEVRNRFFISDYTAKALQKARDARRKIFQE
jgi:hypothetical protein